MWTINLGQMLALLAAGAFLGLGAFFWLISALAAQRGDEGSGCAGRVFAFLSMTAGVTLLLGTVYISS